MPRLAALALLLFAAQALSREPLHLLDTKPAPSEQPSEWAVAKVTLTSGSVLVVNYRQAAPPKVTRPAFQWRVTLKCRYPDRGDTSGLPSVEVLRSLQKLEATLGAEANGAIRLMAKTGESAREMVFQVKDKVGFAKAATETAEKLALECQIETSQDPNWSLWSETVKKLTGK